MTFTEAAVEVLRRSGKPLHYKDITAQAVEAGLLSHVGQLPEVTMGARLLAMARRDQGRRVSSVGDGVYALTEWGLPAVEPPAEGVDDGLGEDDGPAYRARERHPPLQEEVMVGGRREERRRRSEDDGERRKKRYAPPAEVAHKWLRANGNSATLADLAAALRAEDSIAEALERDLKSLEKALREENRRCADTGRTPLFAIENGTVRALPPGQAKAARPQREPARVEKREEPRAVPVAEEQRRSVLRTLRRRVGGLDVAAFERTCVAILEAQGYRELNMARRSQKDGPLYLARRRWGANELRYTLRILPPGRDIGRSEVQDLRRDLSHYSAQIGVVFGTAECTRESKSEANVPGAAPVMLYGSEAVAEALIDAGLGVATRTIEWLEFDDSFFASVGAPEAEADHAEPQAREERKETGDDEDRDARKDERAAARREERREERKERSRRQKDRRRERRGGEAAKAKADGEAQVNASVSPESAGQPDAEGTSETVASPGTSETTAPSATTAASDTAAQAAAAETPVAETLATEKPVTGVPSADASVTGSAATEAPGTETPASETPVMETPVTEAPGVDVIATESPVAETLPTESTTPAVAPAKPETKAESTADAEAAEVVVEADEPERNPSVTPDATDETSETGATTTESMAEGSER